MNASDTRNKSDNKVGGQGAEGTGMGSTWVQFTEITMGQTRGNEVGILKQPCKRVTVRVRVSCPRHLSYVCQQLGFEVVIVCCSLSL